MPNGVSAAAALLQQRQHAARTAAERAARCVGRHLANRTEMRVCGSDSIGVAVLVLISSSTIDRFSIFSLSYSLENWKYGNHENSRHTLNASLDYRVKYQC